MEPNRYLIISGHDFRSKRKANMQFIAQELAKRGTMRFFSVGFSLISRLKKDPRSSLWDRTNQVEIVDGVESYLWRSLLHPFNLHFSLLNTISAWWFKAYVQAAPKLLHQWIITSDVIIIESGMGIIFYDLVRKLNPAAKIIYLCSDTLEAISSAPYIIGELARASNQLDGICIPSKQLWNEFPASAKVFYVPHGIDAAIFAENCPTPYKEGINLVSVGSMLFDASFFESAAKAFPEITFHIIGGGTEAVHLSAPNIIVYDEMPFRETLPYLKHAEAGIAPYKKDHVAPYLADTSMKLMQFECLGIPAVCPQMVTGDHKTRFGYDPENPPSIVKSIKDALAYGRFEMSSALSWGDVASRIIEPGLFPDTQAGV